MPKTLEVVLWAFRNWYLQTLSNISECYGKLKQPIKVVYI